MRRTPSIVALLLAVVACAVVALLIAAELRRTVPDRSPREGVHAAAQERQEQRQARFASQDRAWDVPFHVDMVRDRVVWRADDAAPPTTDVTLVNATPGADLAASARACARQVGRSAGTRVQCYAFANTEAYEFKDVTGDLDLAEPTAIVNLCWAVLASTARAGGPITVSDMRLAPQTWSAQGCPDSWTGAAQGGDA